MQNPFKYGGIVSGPFFADRVDEIAELRREMENTSRVFLISPRRFGKTCLLHNLMPALAAQGTACAYVDLNAAPDLRALAGAVAGATAKAIERNTDRLIKLFSGFQRLRPKLSLDPEGNLSATVEFVAGEQDAFAALMEAMAHAERLAAKRGRRLVLIIDEFSDIEKYNGGDVEKALRAEIQSHRHVGYIFSGSAPSVMLSMVQDKRRPFYKMGRLMSLGPIQRHTYAAFIAGWLKKGGYRFDDRSLERILFIGEDVPYNVQRLCNAMWEAAMVSKRIDVELVETLPMRVARQDSAHYEMLWQTATPLQRVLLMALGGEPEALPFSKEFQLRHGVGPSSSIKASLESLRKKGILTQSAEGRYRFTDHFMPYWIKSLQETAAP